MLDGWQVLSSGEASNQPNKLSLLLEATPSVFPGWLNSVSSFCQYHHPVSEARRIAHPRMLSLAETLRNDVSSSASIREKTLMALTQAGGN
jgi:hypothetical protein